MDGKAAGTGRVSRGEAAMKNQKRLIFFVVLGLIAGTAGALTWLKAHQKLGRPGIQATPLPNSVAMNIGLPAHVPGFTSEGEPQEKIVLDYLPKDTSYARRLYKGADGFYVDANIILAGADRTSIHKPDYCLAGQGLQVDEKAVVNIHIAGPQPYELPVAKWTVSGMRQKPDGEKVPVRGLYVFWFVADNEQTPSHLQHIWWIVRDMLRTGVLQRWAYVSYLSECPPGQEDAAFERIKQLIAASVPEFQLPPQPAGGAVAARQ